jgi:hypothetical protein
MSHIKIGNISGDNHTWGDHNIIINSCNADLSIDKVLTRDEYFKIILEIRDLERISLSNYLQDKYEKLYSKNPHFVKILYKDIYKILDKVDNECDKDIIIESGDFLVEYSDIKLTGYPTNLHFALVWLYSMLVESLNMASTKEIYAELDRFENDFLKINYDTPAYTKKLAELRLQLRKECNEKNKTGLIWKDLNDFIELKPNIGGIGINFNAIFGRLFNRYHER